MALPYFLTAGADTDESQPAQVRVMVQVGEGPPPPPGGGISPMLLIGLAVVAGGALYLSQRRPIVPAIPPEWKEAE